VPCNFDGPELPSPRKLAPGSVSPAYISPPSPGKALIFRPKDNARILELRLFHHFTSVFAPMIPRYGQTAIEQLFSSQVPQICFHFDAVLSAVLTLAAINILSLDPGNTTMRLAAHHHFDQTLSQHSQLVSSLAKENTEGSMLSAMLIIAIMRLQTTFLLDDEPYKLPVAYFHMHHGMTNLYHMSVNALQGSNILCVFGVTPAQFNLDALPQDWLPRVIQHDLFALLEGSEDKNGDPKVSVIYQSAVSYLKLIYVALLREEDPQWTRFRLYAMPSRIPKAFVGLLERKDPRAMAILARFMALSKLCDGTNYYSRIPEYEVQGISSLMPADWQWAMEWPLRILRLAKLADCEVEETEVDITSNRTRESDLIDPTGNVATDSDVRAPTTHSALGSLSIRTLKSDTRNTGKAVNSPVRRSFEVAPIKAERMVVDADEIAARHRDEGECSILGECETCSHFSKTSRQ
jgi:hypothetical protein